MKFRSQIENQVRDYRLVRAANLSILEYFHFYFVFVFRNVDPVPLVEPVMLLLLQIWW